MMMMMGLLYDVVFNLYFCAGLCDVHPILVIPTHPPPPQFGLTCLSRFFLPHSLKAQT